MGKSAAVKRKKTRVDGEAFEYTDSSDEDEVKDEEAE